MSRTVQSPWKYLLCSLLHILVTLADRSPTPVSIKGPDLLAATNPSASNLSSHSFDPNLRAATFKGNIARGIDIARNDFSNDLELLVVRASPDRPPCHLPLPLDRIQIAFGLNRTHGVLINNRDQPWGSWGDPYFVERVATRAQFLPFDWDEVKISIDQASEAVERLDHTTREFDRVAVGASDGSAGSPVAFGEVYYLFVRSGRYGVYVSARTGRLIPQPRTGVNIS